MSPDIGDNREFTDIKKEKINEESTFHIAVEAVCRTYSAYII
jgi:hypothetical protein